MKTTTDFQEQMATARRTQILLGAAQVFSQKGYHQATTKEIAAAAEVAEGTIYNYFADKRELLVAMMEQLGARSLTDLLRPDPSDNLKTFLTTFLRDFYQLLRTQGQFAAPIFAELFSDLELRQALYHQLAEPIAAYLRKYLRTRPTTPQVERDQATIIAYAFIGALLANFALRATSLDPTYRHISTEAMIEQLVSLFVEGLHPGHEFTWFIS